MNQASGYGSVGRMRRGVSGAIQKLGGHRLFGKFNSHTPVSQSPLPATPPVPHKTTLRGMVVNTTKEDDKADELELDVDKDLAPPKKTKGKNQQMDMDTNLDNSAPVHEKTKEQKVTIATTILHEPALSKANALAAEEAMNNLEDVTIPQDIESQLGNNAHLNAVSNEILMELADKKDWNGIRALFGNTNPEPTIYVLDTMKEIKMKPYLSGNNTPQSPIIGYKINTDGTITAGTPEELGPWISEKDNWVTTVVRPLDSFRALDTWKAVAGTWSPHWDNGMVTRGRMGSWSSMVDDPNIMDITKINIKDQVFLATIHTKEPSATRLRNYPMEKMSCSIMEVVLVTAPKDKRPIHGTPPKILAMHQELLQTVHNCLK